MSKTKASRADDVRAFHEACGLPVGDPANPGLTHEEALLRARLIAEEVAETMHALGLSWGQLVDLLIQATSKAGPWPAEQQDADLVALADGTADACYVLLGTDVQAGIPSDAVWQEVQRSNMAKAGGPTRSDGKLLKPTGWTPPDVAGVLAKAQREEAARAPVPVNRWAELHVLPSREAADEQGKRIEPAKRKQKADE